MRVLGPSMNSTTCCCEHLGPKIPDRDYETWTEYMRHVFEGAVAASGSLPNVQQILWDFAETQVYKKLDF